MTSTQIQAQEKAATYQAPPKVATAQSSQTWRWARIGELGRYINGRAFKPTEWETSGLPIIRIQNLNDESARFNYTSAAHDERFRVRTGDLLISWAASLGVYIWRRGDAWLNQHTFRVEVNEALVTKAYLFYAISASIPTLYAKSHGSGMVHVTKGVFEDQLVRLPSLPAQIELVAYLDEQLSRLDASVAALHRVQANLKRYRASVLKAACEGRLVPTEAELARQEGREFETGAELLQRVLSVRASLWPSKSRGAEPATPNSDNLPTLPEGWAWASAEQLCGFITKGTTPSAEKLLPNGEVQFLKVYNLTDSGELNQTYKPAFVSRETHEGELARSMTAAGDVLMNIVGPPLGQVSVVPPALAEANINQAIARFRTVLPEMNRYLAQALLTRDVLDRSLHQAKTTVGQVNLTLQICREIAIPLPPLAEQHRIVAEADRRLSLIRMAENQVAANLARAQRLRQSILQAAFATPA